MKKLGIPLLLVLIIASTSLFAQDTLLNVSLKEIWTQYKFMGQSVRGINSLKNGKEYTMIKKGSLVVYDYKTGDSITTLIVGEDLVPEGSEKPLRLGSFTMSENEDKFLIPANTEAIYRHSTKSDYYIWDNNTRKLTLLSKGGKQSLADFSPDGTKVAFVRDNNIFIVDLASGKESQITSDGEHNKIINGTCDWVYEEEFGFTKAFFWSPDGSKIAFYRFDESNVREYTIEYYGELYPKWETYKYPKAGEDNSIVEIHVFDLNNAYTSKMDVGEDPDQYIPRISWTNDLKVLAIQRLNRLQNHLDILLADSENGDSHIMYSEDNKYYIDITDNLTFLKGNDSFLISSEKDGFNHLYLYNIDGSLKKQLTQGNWEVTNVYGFDARNNTVYYQSTESSPLNRDIYSVNLKGKKTKVSQKEGTNSANFSSSFNYYINTYSSLGVPPVYSVATSKGKEVRILEDNARLRKLLSGYKISKPEFFTFTTPEITMPDGSQIELNAWKILPYDFDPDKEYPVLITIYGGPGSQEVKNAWGGFNYMWYQMLAENGIMIVSVDNRGTGARGEEFKKMTYLELGKYETLDYIETAKYLGDLPYVNKDRIGIFGWSYGGFMASNALFQGADYFNTGIAVAPVTNWRYYDNIYTERFMRTPQENPDGYDNNSPINHVEKLVGNYLLVHGDADDNVHPQNSMDLVTALVNADKQFDFMLYPNKNHGIYGGNTRYHLFNKMTNFLYENLLDKSLKKKKTCEKADLGTLINYMEGSFSSEKQAVADTNYMHITLDMKQIWKDRDDGAWLYVEQTAAWTPGKPYRQRVYHLEQTSDSTFTSSIYKMPEPEKYIGGHLYTKMFEGLTADSISILEGCALNLLYNDGIFAGSTNKGECINSWGKAAYATSEVTISPNLMLSWDRGWNSDDEHVWGAENGGYEFVRVDD